MKLLVLADADDARAFRLMGTTAVVCCTAADVDRAIRDDVDGSVALLLVSAPVYRNAPRTIDALSRAPHAPAVLVLP